MPSPKSQQTVSRFRQAHCGRAWKGARVCRAPSRFGDGSPLPTGKVPSDVAYCRWIRSEKDQPSRWSERWKFVLFDGRVRWRWGGNKKRQGKTQRVKTGQASSVRTPLKRQDKTTEVSHDFPLCTHHSMSWTRVCHTRTALAWSRAGPSASLTRSPLVEAGWRGPHVPHVLTWRVLWGRPHAEPDAGSTDTSTCAKHSCTRTEQGTPAITQTDMLPHTHSSYKDDGKGTLNPLTTHWEEHIRRSKFYQVWKKCSKWWMENLLPRRAAPPLQTKS